MEMKNNEIILSQMVKNKDNSKKTRIKIKYNFYFEKKFKYTPSFSPRSCQSLGGGCQDTSASRSVRPVLGIRR